MRADRQGSLDCSCTVAQGRVWSRRETVPSVNEEMKGEEERRCERRDSTLPDAGMPSELPQAHL